MGEMPLGLRRIKLTKILGQYIFGHNQEHPNPFWEKRKDIDVQIKYVKSEMKCLIRQHVNNRCQKYWEEERAGRYSLIVFIELVNTE